MSRLQMFAYGSKDRKPGCPKLGVHRLVAFSALVGLLGVLKCLFQGKE
jgi:hypothetical protein